MKKLVYGVGTNDADYPVTLYETIICADGKQKRKQVWVCPFYQTWGGMLERSYSEKYKAKYPTYDEAATLQEWHLFSTFKSWMEQQEWEGKQLDKDLLIRGNKVYGPDTCVFVSRRVNTFLIDSSAARGEWMIGVCWNKDAAKFMAMCCNPWQCAATHLQVNKSISVTSPRNLKHTKLGLNVN